MEIQDALTQIGTYAPAALCPIVIVYGWYFARRLIARIEKLEDMLNGRHALAQERHSPPPAP